MNTGQLFDEYKKKYGTIAIDLGCGPNKKTGYIGIDILDLPGVDLAMDIENGLSMLPDSSVDEIYTSHFLEHIQNYEFLLSEMYRILKPGGALRVVVPHFTNPYYYSDYTHKRFFGLYSFDYFSDGANSLPHKVPVYNTKLRFTIVSRRLVFKSGDFKILNLLRKHILTRIFNAGNYFQAVYEEIFSGWFRCSELQFVLRVVK